MSTSFTPLQPSGFGPPAGPYSQGLAAGDLIFVAGQVAIDENNEVVAPGDVRTQTIVALERIEAILAEAGASLENLASTTVWLTDLADFAEFNAGWAEKLGDHRPTRATVTSQLLLDGLRVEIQGIAVRGGSSA